MKRSRRLMIPAPVSVPASASAIEDASGAKALARSPTHAAASMTPAENPRTTSFHLCGNDRTASPSRTPIVVEHPTDRRTIIKIFMAK